MFIAVWSLFSGLESDKSMFETTTALTRQSERISFGLRLKLCLLTADNGVLKCFQVL